MRSLAAAMAAMALSPLTTGARSRKPAFTEEEKVAIRSELQRPKRDAKTKSLRSRERRARVMTRRRAK